MKKTVLAMVLIPLLFAAGPANAVGVIVTSIKTHTESRPSLRDRAADRNVQSAQRARQPRRTAPDNPIEAYVLRLLESLAGR